MREGSRRHEYAPHIHFDFEPDSALPPQPRLQLRRRPRTASCPREYYDAAHNPDHKFHGWDGARKGIAYVREEGDLARPDTKAGSLRAATRLLAPAGPRPGPAAGHAHRAPATSAPRPRTSSASFRALEANGLLANADAGPLRTRGRTSARPADLLLPALRPGDGDRRPARGAGRCSSARPRCSSRRASLDELNAWFERRLAQAPGAGVRAVVAMTHAMFMKGAPDPFRDTTGGDFEKLDQHLEYVRRQHPRGGLRHRAPRRCWSSSTTTRPRCAPSRCGRASARWTAARSSFPSASSGAAFRSGPSSRWRSPSPHRRRTTRASWSC